MLLNNERKELMLDEALKETDFDYYNLTMNGNNYYVYLVAYSSAGGENSIEMEGTTFENLLENIIDYADNFDADEEFNVWYGRNNGEPSTPSALLKDCEEKAEQWETLSAILKKLLVELELIRDYGIAKMLKQIGSDSYYLKTKDIKTSED